jgi:outer membrane protein OmpA-like peptidoglycan-associated protein/tetratricopeptide (TPR) repeat protein
MRIANYQIPMNPIRIFSIFLLLFLAVPAVSYSQDDENSSAGPCAAPDDEEAKKNFEKSKDRKKYDWNERMALLNQVLEAQPTWAEPNLAKAKMLINKAKADGNGEVYPMAIPYLKAAVDNCPEIGAEPLYQLGTQYYLLEDWANAVLYLNKYINYNTDDPKKFGAGYDFNVTQAQEMIRWSTFYLDINKTKHPFTPQPVTNVCTSNDEYLAMISPDNTLFLYIRVLPINQMDRVWGTTSYRETFTQSERQGTGDFDNGHMLEDPFNMNPNEGSATLTIDNKHLFYTITKDANTDIYTTDMVDGGWTPIRPIGDKVNDPTWWDSQPSVSADGSILYFASNRPGGQGGIDIWYTKKLADGTWGVPVNAGPVINTEYDEKSPFIHSDSQTLYFSSNGHPGLGNYDIFYSRADAKGAWQIPVNLGIPINTAGDDLGFFVSTDGVTGYFCSNSQMPGRVGGWDVYQFELYQEARPEAVVILKGELKDEFGNPLTGAVNVEVKNVTTKQKTSAVVDTTSGSFAAAIKVSKKDDYVITVKKDSAAFNSQLISTRNGFASSSVPVQPMEVKKLKNGQAYTIHDINFASNSAVLEPESMVVLEEFAQYLKEHPNMKIAIYGHTDNLGDDSKNMALSGERAYAVFEALTVKFGVPRNQITTSKGFGETRPVADNGTELGRAKNRRTEFVIIDF